MALTPIPAAGAKLRGATLAALMLERQTLSGLKTIDQNVGPSNTTLQDVTDVSISVVANAVYRFTLDLQYASNGTADIKFGFTLPSGAAGDYEFWCFNISAVWAVGRSTMAGTISFDGASNAAHLSGTITVGANAGTVQLQAAQNTSTAVTTNVEAGTILTAWRIS